MAYPSLIGLDALLISVPLFPEEGKRLNVISPKNTRLGEKRVVLGPRRWSHPFVFSASRTNRCTLLSSTTAHRRPLPSRSLRWRSLPPPLCRPILRPPLRGCTRRARYPGNVASMPCLILWPSTNRKSRLGWCERESRRSGDG